MVLKICDMGSKHLQKRTKNWDIQDQVGARINQGYSVVLGFANFYQQLIKRFSKIEALLTSMLQTTPIAETVIPLKAVDNSILLIIEFKLVFLQLR